MGKVTGLGIRAGRGAWGAGAKGSREQNAQRHAEGAVGRGCAGSATLGGPGPSGEGEACGTRGRRKGTATGKGRGRGRDGPVWGKRRQSWRGGDPPKTSGVELLSPQELEGRQLGRERLVSGEAGELGGPGEPGPLPAALSSRQPDGACHGLPQDVSGGFPEDRRAFIPCIGLSPEPLWVGDGWCPRCESAVPGVWGEVGKDLPTQDTFPELGRAECPLEAGGESGWRI